MTCLIGDCRDLLPTLPEQSVQMCVTSPPYWGLRDYGTGQWDGGSAECEHRKPVRQGASGVRANRANIAEQNGAYSEVCEECGARRIDRQLGLESTPGEYMANMVEVFREVRRVLRDDGTLWLNLGDSYANNPASTGKGRAYERAPGLKVKDLCGIPWRVAFALQADGWYLRQDIIWHKPNPMPESVRDRCTKAHEYLFLLSKRERYYFDSDAIAEPLSGEPHAPGNIALAGGKNDSGHMEARVWGANGTRNKRSVWTVTTKPFSGAHFATFPPELVEPCILAGSKPGDTVLDPFMGSGTTAQVAQALGRQWIGCELNPEYETLQRARTAQQGMVLA